MECIYKKSRLIYENPLAKAQDVHDFCLEGQGALSFPMGRMRLENKMDPEKGQDANYVFWCPEEFPDHIEITWEFTPIREPGLCILFFSAQGKKGEDIFDPSLGVRKGPYDQYHSGDINTLHISYFRRRYEEERQFHCCNLRKSYGFHLLTQGADPIPSVCDVKGSYHMKVVKSGGHVLFYCEDLLLFEWEDDGQTYGPILKGGKIGFRQMAPLIGEYANLKVHTIEWLS
jgi:hypothetical protein